MVVEQAQTRAHTLSVGITYFGEADLLTRCILSLLNGSAQPDEILVYDDASPIPAERFIPRHADVRVIRGEINTGVSFSRNQLMQESNCDYIRFHDADDPFHPEWCATIYKTINDSTPDVIITGLRVQRDGVFIRSGFLDSLKKFPQTDDLTLMALRYGPATQEVTLKRRLGLDVGGFRSRIEPAEDSEFFIRLAFASKTYVFVDAPVALRELRPNSLSLDENNESRIEYISARYQMARLLVNDLPQTYHDELAEMVARTAVAAATLGEYELAKRGVALAASIGNVSYKYYSGIQRFLIRMAGPVNAGIIIRHYRRRVPPVLRRSVRRVRFA